MPETTRPLLSVTQTGREMLRLALAYQSDMGEFATLTPLELFSLLKKLPYRKDPEGVEYLKRPYYTLKGYGLGGDCDDKAIAVGAWAALNHIPFRFVAVARHGKPLHHVFTEIFYGGAWRSMDVTYGYNTLDQHVLYSQRKVLVTHGA